jgi:S-(hydroxymethyl)glutathione dehydrogenase/alcohol dehydrogenase
VDLFGAELWLILDRTILENSNVAVFGVGCVGLSILQGARAKKCAKVIAIDVNNGKKETALKFGASKPRFLYFSYKALTCSSADFINPKELPEGQSIVDKLIEMTDGGCDFTFDATGNVQVMRQALEACHKGWGVSTIIGVAPAGAEISTRP